MELVTQVKGKNISEFTIEYSDEYKGPNVDQLVNYLKEYIEEGAIFETDQTFQYLGFTLVCSVNNNKLSFSMPDLENALAEDIENDSVPWTNDLTFMLMKSLEHVYVPESFGYDFDMPSLQQTALVVTGFDRLPMSMNRLELDYQKPDDSGWGFNTGNPEIDQTDESNFSIMTLWEVVVRAPQVLAFLSMPIGTMVGFKEGGIFFFHNDTGIEPEPGSYVSEVMNL